jgi:hypothetical protein
MKYGEAEIVAWLRERLEHYTDWQTVRDVADDIERGAHRGAMTDQVANTALEAYLMQELRRLQDMAEGHVSVPSDVIDALRRVALEADDFGDPDAATCDEDAFDRLKIYGWLQEYLES